MVNKVVWTQKAVNQMENVLNFLSDEVSEKAATKFLETVLNKVKTLENNTYEGRPIPNKKTIRFVIIEKHHRLYYRRNGLTLYVAQIYDTRQHPDKKPYSK